MNGLIALIAIVVLACLVAGATSSGPFASRVSQQPLGTAPDFRGSGDEPGLQFYAGNFLDGAITAKGSKVHLRRAGFCMKPQRHPGSPNKPDFPSVELKPGQTFHNAFSINSPPNNQIGKTKLL